MDKDITSQVDFYENDGEILPLTKCVCGKTFPPWDFCLSIYREDPHICGNCGRRMYFRAKITVYEIVGGG